MRTQNVLALRLGHKIGATSWLFLIRSLVWLCIGLACIAYGREVRHLPDVSRPLELVVRLLAAALFFTAVMPYVSQSTMRKHALDPNGSFLSPKTVALSPESISISSARGNSVLPWSGVLARDEDEMNYYLFIDATQVVVLPRSVVAPVAAQFDQYTRHLTRAA